MVDFLQASYSFTRICSSFTWKFTSLAWNRLLQCPGGPNSLDRKKICFYFAIIKIIAVNFIAAHFFLVTWFQNGMAHESQRVGPYSNALSEHRRFLIIYKFHTLNSSYDGKFRTQLDLFEEQHPVSWLFCWASIKVLRLVSRWKWAGFVSTTTQPIWYYKSSGIILLLSFKENLNALDSLHSHLTA